MNDKKENPSRRALVLLGMHRSGTSLTAQWLNSCGLNFGDELLGAAPSNKFGHFEDADFLNLHRDILKFNGYRYNSDIKGEMSMTTYYQERARHIVSLKNKLRSQWGFKDPRACLFTTLWDSTIDNAKYLIVYRNPYQVVDSLLRREYKAIDKSRNILNRTARKILFNKNLSDKADAYMQSWLLHNKTILEFIANKKIGKDFLITSQGSILEKSQLILSTMQNEWHFDLEPVELSEVFSKKHFNLELRFKPKFSDKLVADCESVLIGLDSLNGQ